MTTTSLRLSMLRRLVDVVIGFLRPDKRSERSSRAERLERLSVEHDRLVAEVTDTSEQKRRRFLWKRP